MLTDRNAMSHEYDAEAFEAVAHNVHRRYLGLFVDLRELLSPELSRGSATSLSSGISKRMA